MESATITEAEEKALAAIATATDPGALLRIAKNARVISKRVERAALKRMAVISAKHDPGTVEHECWAMVHAVEGLRRLNGRKGWRMNRMRRKIEKDSEAVALAYCAEAETEGFREIMDYGSPELTAEAIVLRHQARFSPKVVNAARSRLEQAGVSLDYLGQI